MARIRGRLSTPYTAFLLLVLLLQLSGLGCPISGAQAQSNNAGPAYSYVPDDSSPNSGKVYGPFPSLQSAVQSATQYYTALDGPSGTNPKASCHIIYSPYTYYYGGLEGFVEYTASPGNTQAFCQVDGNDFAEVFASFVNYDPGKNAGTCDCDKSGNGQVGATSTGSSVKSDPVNTATGNKFEQETDYPAPSDWLTLRRFYNSHVAVVPTGLGTSWRHSFDRSLIINSTTSINLFRPDGRYELFQKANGAWTPDADVADTLTEQDDSSGTPTGYSVFVAGPRQTEQYSAAGLLQSITDPDGKVTTLTYSTASTPASVAPAANLLLTVTDPQGRALNFTYNSNSQLATVTQPDGGVLTYGYDTSGNLNSVQYPDGKTRQYTYNESTLTGGANLPGVLTGTIDESSTRYESTTYNSNGWATSVYHGAAGAGIDLTTFVYGTTAGAGTTLTTPLGAVSNLGYQNALGALKVSGSSAPCGDACNQPWSAQTYDANGYPNTVTDWNGNVTQTTYGSNGLLGTEVDASGTAAQRTTTTIWNNTLRVPLSQTVLNAAGTTVASTAWVYNAVGQTLARCDIDPTVAAAASYTCATSGTVPAGVRRSSYTYCTAVDTTQCPLVGLLLTATGPRTDLTQTTTYTYYLTDSSTSQHGDLQSVTDSLGHTITYLSYDGVGRVLSQQDANGVVTTFTYYPRGWLHTRSVGSATTTITYTPYGAVATVTDPDNITTTYSYDTAHRLIQIKDAMGAYLVFTLDAAGNRIKEQAFDSGNGVRRTFTRQFNTLGQLVDVIDGLNHTVFNASASGNYDGNGNLVHSVDANSIQRQQGYDALDRLTSTIDDYNGTDSLTPNTTSKFGYDALDRLTGVTDPSSLTTKYTYDGLGNRTALQSPDTGTSTDTYDAAGNRLTHTDAKGVVSTSTYDALDRPSATTYADTTLNVSYTYDEANSVTGCPTSNPVGRLTRVIENAVTTIYCYDTHGNVTQKQQITPSATNTTQYTYSPGDRLRTILSPDGTSVYDLYNADGQVSSVQSTPSGGSNTILVSDVAYLPFGPVLRYTLGNGQLVTRSYDANYALSDLTSPALNLHFARDPMGHIIAEGNAAGASPATETYSYDPLYRLTGITDGTTSIEGLTYNETGDRLTKTGSGLDVGTYAYTSGTHQLSSIGNAARTADANGNTTASTSAGQTWGYGYNGRNRLTVVQASGSTVGTYTYNAMGQRIQKVATAPAALTQRFAYDEQGHLIGEYTYSSHRDTIWLGDIPVATVDIVGTTNTVNYITADQLGTPRAVSNTAGTTIWSWPYVANPFGEVAPTSTTGYVLNLRYPGQYFDIESGLVDNINRIYEQGSSRYLQSDPLGLMAGMSTYAYVSGNPLSSIDPNGLLATVRVSGNTVTVTIPMSYVGPGVTPELTALWNQSIAQTWSGTFGQYNVTTTVIPGGPGIANTNTITVPAGTGRSQTIVDGNTGTWYADDQLGKPNPWTAAHEAGHLMGLEDQYIDFCSNGKTISMPYWGFDNDIMGAFGAPVTSSDIQGVINAHKHWWQR
nr:RHS repeat-associated core domain-containing protein [Rhodanobacter sp. MP1X3]